MMKKSPRPGIEPGPPGWKPGILTPRPSGIDQGTFQLLFKIVKNSQFHTKNVVKSAKSVFIILIWPFLTFGM